MSKLVQLKRITDGAAPPLAVPRFFEFFFGKIAIFDTFWITFCVFSESFKKSKYLRFESQLKKFLSLLQVKFKTRLESCILGLNFVIWPTSGEARYIFFCNIFSVK